MISDSKTISQPMNVNSSVQFPICFHSTQYSLALKQIYINVLRQHIFQIPIHQIRDLFPDLKNHHFPYSTHSPFHKKILISLNPLYPFRPFTFPIILIDGIDRILSFLRFSDKYSRISHPLYFQTFYSYSHPPE